MRGREIRLDQLADLVEDQLEELVRSTTLEWQARLKRRNPPIGTPFDSGDLKKFWLVDVSKKLEGRVYNPLKYAEAVCYGTNLPPSWGGVYRSKFTPPTQPGFPDLIGKELESYVVKEYRNILGRD